eukprot:Polyplicarium_translucidae@DN5380_c0_g1_i1.p1
MVKQHNSSEEGGTASSGGPRPPHFPLAAGAGNLRSKFAELEEIFERYLPNPFFRQLSRWAEEFADDDFIKWVNGNGKVVEELSWKSMLENIKKLATYLRTDLGLQFGDAVILCYPPGTQFAIGFFACLTAGLVAVPVYPPDPSRSGVDVPRCCEIIEVSQAKAVFTDTFYWLGLGDIVLSQYHSV